MKFFLLLALSVMIFGFTAAQQNCTTIQWDPNNQQLVDILNTGFQEALAAAIQDEEIQDATYTWSEVDSVETCTINGSTSYNFSVYLEDSDGDADNIGLNLEVNCDKFGNCGLGDFDISPPPSL